MQKLTIILWAIIQLGVLECPQSQLFSLCIDAPKGASYYPQNIMLQFYVCYHKSYYAALMLLEKLCYMKTSTKFRDQAQSRPPSPSPAKCRVKDFIFYDISSGLLFSPSSCNSHTLRCLACVDSSAKSSSSINFSKQFLLNTANWLFECKTQTSLLCKQVLCI